MEHGLARLSHLGIVQARYVGRVKTRFQLLLAATVANLRCTWNWHQGPATPPDGAPERAGTPKSGPALARQAGRETRPRFGGGVSRYLPLPRYWQKIVTAG